jgi:hypothetical protein
MTVTMSKRDPVTRRLYVLELVFGPYTILSPKVTREW